MYIHVLYDIAHRSSVIPGLHTWLHWCAYLILCITFILDCCLSLVEHGHAGEGHRSIRKRQAWAPSAANLAPKWLKRTEIEDSWWVSAVSDHILAYLDILIYPSKRSEVVSDPIGWPCRDDLFPVVSQERWAQVSVPCRWTSPCVRRNSEWGKPLKNGGWSIVMGKPQISSISRWDFPHKNTHQRFWGTPWRWKPPFMVSTMETPGFPRFFASERSLRKSEVTFANGIWDGTSEKELWKITGFN